MKRQHVLLCCAIALLGSAGCKREPPPPAAGPAPAPAPAPVPTPAPAGPDALKVERLADGKVQVTGTDLWNNPIDITYENAEFFKNAVPVLSRSVTPKEAEALEAAAAAMPESR